MADRDDKTWTKGSNREKSQFVLEIGRRKTQVRLTFGKVILGRHPKLCNIIFNHSRVSRQHCGVIVTVDQITLQDFKSRNGTLLNGKRIDHQELKVGDVFSIAGINISVQSIPLDESGNPIEQAAIKNAAAKKKRPANKKSPAPEQPSQTRQQPGLRPSTVETKATETDAFDDELPFDIFGSDDAESLPEDVLNTMFDFDDD